MSSSTPNKKVHTHGIPRVIPKTAMAGDGLYLRAFLEKPPGACIDKLFSGVEDGESRCLMTCSPCFLYCVWQAWEGHCATWLVVCFSAWLWAMPTAQNKQPNTRIAEPQDCQVAKEFYFFKGMFSFLWSLFTCWGRRLHDTPCRGCQK